MNAPSIHREDSRHPAEPPPQDPRSASEQPSNGDAACGQQQLTGHSADETGPAKVIQSVYDRLLQFIDSSDLLPLIFRHGVISVTKHLSIQSKCDNAKQHDANKELLNCIMTKGQKGLNVFYTALVENKDDNTADMLKNAAEKYDVHISIVPDE